MSHVRCCCTVGGLGCDILDDPVCIIVTLSGITLSDNLAQCIAGDDCPDIRVSSVWGLGGTIVDTTGGNASGGVSSAGGSFCAFFNLRNGIDNPPGNGCGNEVRNQYYDTVFIIATITCIDGVVRVNTANASLSSQAGCFDEPADTPGEVWNSASGSVDLFTASFRPEGYPLGVPIANQNEPLGDCVGSLLPDSFRGTGGTMTVTVIPAGSPGCNLPVLNHIAVKCSDREQQIVVDARLSPPGFSGILYNDETYALTASGRSEAAPVSVLWINRRCGVFNNIATKCSDETEEIVVDIADAPPGSSGLIYEGNRYQITERLAEDPPVVVDSWLFDPCPPGTGFALATICPSSAQQGATLGAPSTIVYAVDPAIGAGIGGVRLVVEYPNPACPDGESLCSTILRYNATATPATGPGVGLHLAGSSCATLPRTLCLACPGVGSPTLTAPLSSPTASSTETMTERNNRLLREQGFDPTQEVAMIRRGGCCDPPLA